MKRWTLSGGIALALLAGCAKKEEPQPKLVRPAHPDKKFEIQSIGTPQGAAPAAKPK